MPQIPPTPSISGSTVSTSLQSALSFRPTSGAVQGKQAGDAFVPPLQTPQLYSRLVSLQSNLESAQNMSAIIRQAGAAAQQVDNSLMNLARLLPALVREVDGSIARTRLQQQISQNIVKLTAAIVIGTGQSQSNRTVSLSGMSKLKELIADFGQGKSTLPSGLQSFLSDLLGETDKADQLVSQLRNLADALGRGLSNGDLKTSTQLRQLAVLINQALQTNSAIIARLPTMHAAVGNLLLEVTAVPSPSQSLPITDWSVLLNSGALNRELSMTRLLAAHAATAQFVELSRMKKALGTTHRSVEKGKKGKEKGASSPEKSLFENFLTFFSPEG